MKKFGKRIIAGCLASCLLVQCSPSTANAEVHVSFIDDFNGGQEEQPTVTTAPTAVPAPIVTMAPTVAPTVTMAPVATTAPQNTQDPFSPPVKSVTEEPEATADPNATPAPTFSLERPNVSYFCYYDKMEFEKNHLSTNMTKYDENHGAVKERNADIPVRRVRYRKGTTPVIKAKYGSCFRIVLTGVKKYKRVRAGNRTYLTNWNYIRSTKNKRRYRCVMVDYHNMRTYGFRVNGKLFKVKVKPYGNLTAKSSSSFSGKGYTSKYNWKTLMRNVISGGEQIFVPKSVESRNTEAQGRTRYCAWSKDAFYVQGYKIPRLRKNVASAYKHMLAYTGTNIDYVIEHYRIPSATKMTQEECCKWIRRNGKLIKSIYGITKSQGGDILYLSYALYPIFDKAYKYSLSDEYSKNGLVFYHIYNDKPRQQKYTWLKFETRPVDLGYYDKANDSYVEIWGMPTWIGEVYEYTKDSVNN